MHEEHGMEAKEPRSVPSDWSNELRAQLTWGGT